MRIPFKTTKSFGGQLFAVVNKVNEEGIHYTLAFVGETTEDSTQTKHADQICIVHINGDNITDGLKKINTAIGGLRIQQDMLCVYANQQNKTYIATQPGETAKALNGQTTFLKQIANIKTNTKPGDKIRKSTKGFATDGTFDLSAYLTDAGFSIEIQNGEKYFGKDIMPDYISFSYLMSENTQNVTLYYTIKGKSLMGIGASFPEKTDDNPTVNYGSCEAKEDSFGKYYDEYECTIPVNIEKEKIPQILKKLNDKIKDCQPTDKSILACDIPGVFEVYGFYGTLLQMINPSPNTPNCKNVEKNLVMQIIKTAISQTKASNYCILDQRNAISETETKRITEIHNTAKFGLL